jgi:riboflavin synthase
MVVQRAAARLALAQIPMFTGIVEETGRIVAIEPRPDAIRLRVEAALTAKGVKLGESIAVNGCCLTVVGVSGRGRKRTLDFDLLQETWERTNLSDTAVGACVNLERALAVGARLGGHFVTGHIDGTGTISRWERNGQDHVLDIAAPKEVRRYVVFKGSIAVDGISLTVAGVTPKGFRIWIIPHTFAVTALHERKVGDRVNLEADMLGKYVEQFLGKRR